jgi:hypothetical protein
MVFAQNFYPEHVDRHIFIGRFAVHPLIKEGLRKIAPANKRIRMFRTQYLGANPYDISMFLLGLPWPTQVTQVIRKVTTSNKYVRIYSLQFLGSDVNNLAKLLEGCSMMSAPA